MEYTQAGPKVILIQHSGMVNDEGSQPILGQANMANAREPGVQRGC